jgi:transcriptional regulator with XRE-family HTH domain
MPEPSVLGRRLRAFRQRAKITQQALSAKTGIPRTTIAQVESGLQSTVSLENAIKLADALGITIDALVRGDPLQSDMMAAAV